MSVVLDASMAASWLFEDERTEAAHRVMMRVVDDGAIVPSLWRLEMANVLRNATRRVGVMRHLPTARSSGWIA